MKFGKILLFSLCFGLISAGVILAQNQIVQPRQDTFPIKVKGLLDVMKYNDREEPQECELTLIIKVDPKKASKKIRWSEFESGAVMVTGTLYTNSKGEPQIDISDLQKLSN